MSNGTLTISFTSVTQSAIISAIEILPVQTGTISGTVRRASDNSAIGGATVSYGGASTTTDGSGAYTLANVPVGTYTETASATGFQDLSQQNVGVTGGATTTANFSLTAGVRVNAGGPAYIDSHGQIWQADAGFNGGATWSTKAAIAGTSDPGLLQTERYDNGGGAPLQYSFSVPSGAYTVNLYFAEIYSGCFSIGCRVSNVQVQGTTAFSNLDVFAQAGANTALVKSTTTSVSNGTLTISFTSTIGSPIISAIEILQVQTGTISGTVRRASDNSAISGATVSYSGGSTTTDGSGAYTLANVPSGTNTVTASATGFQSLSQLNVSVTGGGTTTTNFSLTAGVRVNAGGPAYVDSHGQTWQADFGFNGGATWSTMAAIAGTTDPGLFQSERYDNRSGAPLQYSFSVPNGAYTLNLYFAEIYNGCFSAGCRVFSVQVQGTTVFSNLDVFAQAGANTALVRSTTVAVSSGTLTIGFTSITGNAIISAIEIVPLTGAQTGTISGTVHRASDNSAISGATVSYVGGSTTTDGSGAYTLANILPGTYTVTASAAGFQISSQQNVSASAGVTTTANFSLTAAILVNAGGPAYIDSHGQTWQADTGFNGGATWSTTAAIAGTSDSTLFQTERYDTGSGAPLQYSFSVPNGNYTVNLYFAEIYSGCFSVGCRVFNVQVQGRQCFPTWTCSRRPALTRRW